jgi:GNAT superfamily N-acetyltransferase
VEFTVRPVGADDWKDVRALRLEMLADTPMAFTETLDRARDKGEWEWRENAARSNSMKSVKLAAITPDGRWIGTMGAYLPAPKATPVLVGVYVTPDFRGIRFGVTDALLEGVEAWARERSDRLSLFVHERNDRAQAAYRKRGFVLTGRSEPYDLNRAERDLEMLKSLR